MNNQLSLFENNKPCVLMSLREEPYNKILNGTKHYEYRTRYLKEESTAYIYISKTKKSIMAKIDFGKPIIGNAKTIASIAESDEHGSYDDMIKYLYNDIGYAIPIKKITLINEISLSKLQEQFPNFVVPQSYYLLDKKKELLSFIEKESSI